MELRIRKLRRTRDWTQSDLARQINSTASSISKYEVGTLEPSIDTLVLMAKAFDVSVDYIIGHSDIPKPGCQNINENIRFSNIAQNNSVIYAKDGEDVKLSKEEIELLRVYDTVSVKGKVKLLSFAFEIENRENGTEPD
ncbi:MAG: helix-turn-helix domain-containing protein [Clostridiales bacterium]|nr:helix-turn-helix domain-containing protein [Clostridiales bacterium]